MDDYCEHIFDSIDGRAVEILKKGAEEKGITKEECTYLLGFGENSLESRMTSIIADSIMRKRNNNAGIISAQIGIEIEPCEGNCKFCNFGKDHSDITKHEMSIEEIENRVRTLSRSGDVQSIFLMTTHKFDLDRMVSAIRAVRRIDPIVEIGVNVGDADVDEFKEMKGAGARAIYHACRLREGIDTDLSKDARIRTMENAKEAGMDVYTCCEPIGPEHEIDEIVDNFFIGIEQGCKQHAVMRRIAVPRTPLYDKGQITEIRLGQLCAVFSLAALQVKDFRYMMVHEPNQYGFVSGANNMAAESGANPRDRKDNTEDGRGWGLAKARNALFDGGFTSLIRGDGSLIRLDLEHLEKTASTGEFR